MTMMTMGSSRNSGSTLQFRLVHGGSRISLGPVRKRGLRFGSFNYRPILKLPITLSVHVPVKLKSALFFFSATADIRPSLGKLGTTVNAVLLSFLLG